MKESPDGVHGRLLEAVHISGYTFERACSELEWLLNENRWKQVGGGFDDINKFLATIDFSEFKIAIEQRKKLAKRLADIQASQRAMARTLGVAEPTIARDLGKDRGATNVAQEQQELKDRQKQKTSTATNVAAKAKTTQSQTAKDAREALKLMRAVRRTLPKGEMESRVHAHITGWKNIVAQLEGESSP